MLELVVTSWRTGCGSVDIRCASVSDLDHTAACYHRWLAILQLCLAAAVRPDRSTQEVVLFSLAHTLRHHTDAVSSSSIVKGSRRKHEAQARIECLGIERVECLKPTSESLIQLISDKLQGRWLTDFVALSYKRQRATRISVSFVMRYSMNRTTASLSPR